MAEWEVGAVADPLLAGNPLVGMIRVLSGPALGATRLYRTSLNPTDGYYPGNGFEVCVRHPDTASYANCWLWRSNSATATFHLLDARIGQTIQTVVRYTLDDAATVAVADAVFSLDSDRKSWVVTGAPVFTVHPTLSGTGRINSPVTFNSGTATGAPTKAEVLVSQWCSDSGPDGRQLYTSFRRSRQGAHRPGSGDEPGRVHDEQFHQ